VIHVVPGAGLERHQRVRRDPRAQPVRGERAERDGEPRRQGAQPEEQAIHAPTIIESVTTLITGATGFVMSGLARHLAERGHPVVAADLHHPDDALRAYLIGLPGPVTFRQVDVADAAAVRELVDAVTPERVVHGAAITAIPAEAERDRFVETTGVNVIGTLHVLDAVRRSGVGRTVVVSSGSVYGVRSDMAPVTEDAAARPEGVYPITKWAAEALARRHAAINALDVAVVRLASPFGPFERNTGSRPLLSAIQAWTRAAIRGEPLRVGGPATAVRDPIYVADVAAGIAAVLLAERLPHDVYNVGWGRGVTTEATLAAIARLVPGLKVELAPGEPSRWPSLARGPLSIERLQRDLGWTPAYDLDSGLAAYVGWLREQG
jgi:UDP-glucose 4-epimerase